MGQGQAIGVPTFGVSRSHRHPVVIHQHMCWNVSPLLNIASVGVELTHDCFSLVHPEGHCWLVQQNMQTYAHRSLVATHLYIYINRRRQGRNPNLRMAWFDCWVHLTQALTIGGNGANELGASQLGAPL